MSRMLFSAVAALAFGLGIANAHAAGDVAEGKKSFAKCHACHQLVEGKNGVGPSLHGLFGRKAGTAPGYKYSSAMQSRSEEHTSELQSLMRISYAVFCLKKKTVANKHDR